MFVFSDEIVNYKPFTDRLIAHLIEKLEDIDSYIFLEKIGGRRVITTTPVAIKSLELKMGDKYIIIVDNENLEMANIHKNMVMEIINSL